MGSGFWIETPEKSTGLILVSYLSIDFPRSCGNGHLLFRSKGDAGVPATLILPANLERTAIERSNYSATETARRNR